MDSKLYHIETILDHIIQNKFLSFKLYREFKYLRRWKKKCVYVWQKSS